MATTTTTTNAGEPLPPASLRPGLTFGTGTVTVAAAEGADPLVLMAALALLTPTQVEQLCEMEAEAFVVACERVIGALHARQSLAMDTLAGRVEERLERQRREHPMPFGIPGPDVHGTVASMLAPALHCSTRAVSKRLEADRWLVCTAESTFSSHWQGDLERFRADVIADASADLDPALRDEFEALVLETSLDEVTGELTLISPRIRQLSRAELTRRARAVAFELDPQSRERAALRAHGERRVVVTPDRRRPGMSRWHVLLPTEVSHEVFAAVDALAGQYARAHPGTPIDGLRADALADLVLGNAQVQTTVELVVPVLAGARGDAGRRDAGRRDPGGRDAGRRDAGRRDADRRDAGGRDAGRSDPVEVTVVVAGQDSPAPTSGAVQWLLPGSVDLPRHGELLPSAIAELLSRPETLLRLARLDPDSSIVQDPKTYRPSASLRRRLRTRDGTCRFPSCQTPAARCDLDHVLPYPAGPTEPDNLISLCRTHHRFKHHGGWRAELRADATVAWTAPDGRVHVTRPRPLRLSQPLDLTDEVDAEVVHQVRRGWRPGLPVGMTLDDLADQESFLPDEPPESAVPPDPEPDDTEPDDTEPDGTGGTGSPLERYFTAVLDDAA